MFLFCFAFLFSFFVVVCSMLFYLFLFCLFSILFAACQEPVFPSGNSLQFLSSKV